MGGRDLEIGIQRAGETIGRIEQVGHDQVQVRVFGLSGKSEVGPFRRGEVEVPDPGEMAVVKRGFDVGDGKVVAVPPEVPGDFRNGKFPIGEFPALHLKMDISTAVAPDGNPTVSLNQRRQAEMVRLEVGVDLRADHPASGIGVDGAGAVGQEKGMLIEIDERVWRVNFAGALAGVDLVKLKNGLGVADISGKLVDRLIAERKIARAEGGGELYFFGMMPAAGDFSGGGGSGGEMEFVEDMLGVFGEDRFQGGGFHLAGEGPVEFLGIHIPAVIEVGNPLRAAHFKIWESPKQVGEKETGRSGGAWDAAEGACSGEYACDGNGGENLAMPLRL